MAAASQLTRPRRSAPRSLPLEPVRSRSVLATAILAASIISRLVWDTLTVNGRNFVDLHVYRDGSAGLTDGSLYHFTYTGATDFALPFTYPPFAAVVLYPLSLIPWTVVALVWQVATFAALYGSAVLALRLCGMATGAYATAALWSAGAIWCEPVRVTLDYGQINVFLMFATLLAATWARSSRGVLAGGALIGLLAGIKLTPAITGLWYLAIRRPLGAVSAAIAFLATVIGCYIFFPDITRTYYRDLIGDADRIGPVARPINQSLRGALTRIVGHDVGTSWIWMIAALVALILAIAAWRKLREDTFGVLIVVQLLGLLISPISWTHHWVWLLPIAIWLIHGGGRRRRGAPVVFGIWFILSAAGIPWLLKIFTQVGWNLPNVPADILGASWSLMALATLIWIAVADIRPEPANTTPDAAASTTTTSDANSGAVDGEPAVVVAAAIIDGGRLLLAQRSRPAALAGKWELPGGRVEPAETAHDAVRREIREELGVDVEPAEQLGGEVALSAQRVLRAYRAGLVSGAPRALEHLDLRWVSAAELRDFDLDTMVPADRAWLPALIDALGEHEPTSPQV
ncbi:mannosyltransferase [Gordonia sp. ABSL1-1]|uniref:mannosyltransferase n=1 Tax=Gordonia sp. ABSL1-1 TaxID=3053923 RepID=UPI002572BA39|nr:mannosyltransferase [Gordonia sp. ABSL1-1]MDL9937382.1 mannosyltransferase [Gordonia sp. ABSL1-1]